MTGIAYARLSENEAPAFAALTFPAYRPFLSPLAPEVMAIAAWSDGEPAALALALLDEQARHAELCSLFVRAPFRRRSLGATVLSRLEDALKDAGFQVIEGTYMTGKPSIPVLEHLLSRQAWEPPDRRMLVLRARYETMSRAPWVEKANLPVGFAIGRWDEITPAERDALFQSQAETPWVAPDLWPFDFEEGSHAPTSVVLRRDGAVVGWLLTHLIGDVLRYTCSYVHPDLQRRARILPLYAEVMHRAHALGIEKGMWTVPTHHPAMLAFAMRWMAPYAEACDETRGTRKVLTLL